jgi:catechol 2,3-dioxygenase-like lactoylglutathione lyase family enzyme
VSPGRPRLVPELAVTDVVHSLVFWVDLLGFSVKYARVDEGFACLALDGAEVMLDQRDRGPLDRRGIFETGPMEPPFGRGMNLEIEIESLGDLLERVETQGWPIFHGPEERWYRAGPVAIGVRQILLQDPDGYLVRLQQRLGERPV